MFQGAYVLLRSLVSGVYSSLHVARHLGTREVVVLKRSRKGSQIGRELVKREHGVLRTLKHPHILPLLGAFELGGELTLVLPYISGGTLGDHLAENGAMGERQARGIFRQIVYGLQYCHARGVVHLDIKPDNIMLGDLDQVHIIDFGLSQKCHPEGLRIRCGTPGYMAPEVIQGGPYGSQVDIWSLGVVLHVMATATEPFVHGCFERPLVLPQHLSCELRDLLAGMLTIDPQQRADWGAIMTHPWVTMGSWPMEVYEEPPQGPKSAPPAQPGSSTCPGQMICTQRGSKSCPQTLFSTSCGGDQDPGPRCPANTSASLSTEAIPSLDHKQATANNLQGEGSGQTTSAPLASRELSQPASSSHTTSIQDSRKPPSIHQHMDSGIPPSEQKPAGRSPPPTSQLSADNPHGHLRRQSRAQQPPLSGWVPIRHGWARRLLDTLLHCCCCSCCCCCGPRPTIHRGRRVHPSQ